VLWRVEVGPWSGAMPFGSLSRLTAVPIPARRPRWPRHNREYPNFAAGASWGAASRVTYATSWSFLFWVAVAAAAVVLVVGSGCSGRVPVVVRADVAVSPGEDADRA
jgi:hypothetical protein